MPYKPAETFSATTEEYPELFELANIVGKDRDWSVQQTIIFLATKAGTAIAEEIKKRKAKE